MAAKRILLIEDDRGLAAMLAEYLGQAGLEVDARHTAAEGEAALARARPDAVILDVMLPDGDGFEICRRIRAGSDLPVLMLTARGEDTDRIVGLEIGADDYLPKPFNPRELLARLRAVLRRAAGSANRPAVLRFGRLEMDREARAVRLDGDERRLTAHQFDLLLALAENAGRVMSREALLDRLGMATLESYERSVDVHVSRIRAAIEDDPRRPQRLLTLRGAGYLFSTRQD